MSTPIGNINNKNVRPELIGAPKLKAVTPVSNTQKPSASPAAIVSFGQSNPQGIGLYNRSGIAEKPASPVTFTSGLQGKVVRPTLVEAPKGKAAPAKTAPVAQQKPSSPAGIVSLGQAHPKDIGLYSKTGATEKFSSPVTLPTPQPVSKTEVHSSPVTSNANSFIAGSGQVVVDIKNSDSGYENKIYWSSDNFATRHYLGVDNNTGTFNLGSFKPGTKIDFGIENGGNQFYRTGSASDNSDNFEHAKVNATADGAQIGFEDLAGGGDRDFNDAIISIRNTPAPNNSPVTAPSTPSLSKKPTVSPAQPKGNRSGLGDGTNPGQGAGRINSPNQGTNNPSVSNKGTTASNKVNILDNFA